MAEIDCFTPIGATVNIVASGVSANIALTNPIPGQNRVLRVYNAGTGIAFIEFGGASDVAAAAATSMPLGPGATEFFHIGNSTTYVAAMGAGTVYFTQGLGS